MNRKTLATYYYLDHFREMLRFNLEINGDLLAENHADFIAQFQVLNRNAQCLYIRMANRKQHIFNKASVVYEEIKDVAGAASELLEAGFIRQVVATNCIDLLAGFTKPQLIELAGQAVLAAIKPSWPKAKIHQALLQQLSAEQVMALVNTSDYWVQDRRSTLDYLLFLYFGSPKLDLKQFTLRDLGILRVNDNEHFSARFNSRSEALCCFRLTQIRQQIHADDLPHPEELMNELLTMEEMDSGPMARFKDKALYELGRWFAANGKPDSAIKLLRQSNLINSQKRYIRLQYSVDPSLAQSYLESMLEQAPNDELYLFAKDFYARKFASERLSLQTSRLREGELICLDDSYRHSAERGLIDYFKQQGWIAWFCENHLWRCLFGLTFWDQLFEDPRAVHSNFDRLPQSLRDKSFATLFKSEIEKKIEDLSQGRLMLPLVKTLTAHHNQPNGIFRWQKFKLEPIQALLAPSTRAKTAQILRQMAADFPAMKDGYPDLLLTKGDQLRLIEVKADGDQLRPNQLARLHQLQGAGFDCEINRVVYRFNPNQTFVVVDLETTGGKKPHHRVTEIGAVKVKSGQVIEEFTTLINPDRPIPAGITELTGISNAMVKDAPRFGEIANELYQFLEGSIFVAHNVNFDYGFLQMEYERLAQPFRFPKFCTVVNSKKYFPGLKSYSLANLCAHFDIGLENHHRAMADAKATTELLRLINLERHQRQNEKIPLLNNS